VSWLTDRRRIWRVMLLALLAISTLGPWVFGITHVPTRFPCSEPNVRLRGDFCGSPMPFSGGILAILNDLPAMLADTAFWPYFVPNIMSIGFMLLPLLPLLSGAILLWRENHAPLHGVHLVAVKLTLLITGLQTLLLGLIGRLHWTLWGLWLYLSTMVLLLALEIMLRRTKSATG
jgi:hypothetical protein